MKDTIDRLFAFGFGLAIASKEQAEKFVDELVEKGKVAKEESSSAVEELIKKGEEYQKKWEADLKANIREFIDANEFVPREEYEALKQKVEALEQRVKELEEK